MHAAALCDNFVFLVQYLGRKRRKSLLQALNKIKSGEDFCSRNYWLSSLSGIVLEFSYLNNADLMLLGFISLLLTVSEKQIANICIPEGVAESFLPCQSLTSDEEEESKCQEQVTTCDLFTIR